jgi:hypothetical protein
MLSAGCRQLQVRPGESVLWRTGSPCSPECAVRGRGKAIAAATYATKTPITDHFSPITLSHPHGRGCGVGRSLRGGIGLGVGVGRIVAVGVAVGVGDPPPGTGTMTITIIGSPVLKKPICACAVARNMLVVSKLKLYNVPKRIAFAFGFCANVSVLQLTVPLTVHGVLLYPALFWVPSCAKPGC